MNLLYPIIWNEIGWFPVNSLILLLIIRLRLVWARGMNTDNCGLIGLYKT